MKRENFDFNNGIFLPRFLREKKHYQIEHLRKIH